MWVVSNYDTSVPRTTRYAMDFDLNWQNQGRAANGPRLKRVVDKPANRQWCDATGSFNWTVNLPNEALIVRIVVHRAPTTSNVAYALNVGNGNQTVVYGTSGASNTDLAQTIVVDLTTTPANWIHAGTSAPGNQVQLWCSSTASGPVVVGFSGYFYFEYY